MLQRIKQQLAHVDAMSIRYRLVRVAVSERRLRRAKACTFYWVYLPLAILALIVIPFITVLMWLATRPIAWMAGYRRTEVPLLPKQALEPHASPPPIYENAHVKFAPWRIVLPLIGAALFIWLTMLFPKIVFVSVGLVAIAVGIGWIVWRVRRPVSDKWSEWCPSLVVESDVATETAQ
jgi:hypothetical protein